MQVASVSDEWTMWPAPKRCDQLGGEHVDDGENNDDDDNLDSPSGFKVLQLMGAVFQLGT